VHRVEVRKTTQLAYEQAILHTAIAPAVGPNKADAKLSAALRHLIEHVPRIVI
jgi:hypothetical protein